jgi:cell division protein FtsN
MAPKKSEAKKLYRVQVGAFGEKDRAEAYRDKLKTAGFPVYIVTSGGMYKLQVGAFQDKDLAEALLARVRAVGFDAFITTEDAPVVQAVQTATDPAQSYAARVAGRYSVTASMLNVRSGAGTGKQVMVTIPNGTVVQNFGYYTVHDGVKWLYIQFTHKGATYNGFAHSGYLRKV